MSPRTNDVAVPQVMIGYLEEFWTTYLDAPRRWAAINTMVAHEHFMLRLPSLDADLAAMLLRIAPTILQDTVVILLSDHGTHGIWYNDFAIGQAEHRNPALIFVLPEKFVHDYPSMDSALRRNRDRLLTAYDLHATLRHLAHWPEMPEPMTHASSLMVELPENRSCHDARIPAEFCMPQRDRQFEDCASGRSEGGGTS